MTPSLPPFPLQDIRDFPYSFQDWLRKLQTLVGGTAGMISWASIDKTGSNLTDIVTRNHNSLQNIQGGTSGEFYHFTNSQHSALIGAADTTLHFHTADRTWTNFVFTSSNLTDIATRNHNSLQTLQGGTTNEYYHLTSAQQAVVASLPTIVSGTYTPTLTGVTNTAASTAYSSQYMQVGTVVTVSGRMDVTATLGVNTSTVVGISLPVASTFANTNECAGTANIIGIVAAQNGAINADSTNHRAQVTYLSTGTSSETFYYTFTYRII